MADQIHGQEVPYRPEKLASLCFRVLLGWAPGTRMETIRFCRTSKGGNASVRRENKRCEKRYTHFNLEDVEWLLAEGKAGTRGVATGIAARFRRGLFPPDIFVRQSSELLLLSESE
ncbi:hypothetical protein OUZ56_012437 [Daphnia magna]|uniref:Uncharacterized protein n=1 Tax=Daphnia magna TaxID=35525 RepID=A0ABQ9Z300_9CRUS|nr:hypothetical protein OUZ56_012437 [Daphnia magna]